MVPDNITDTNPVTPSLELLLRNMTEFQEKLDLWNKRWFRRINLNNRKQTNH